MVTANILYDTATGRILMAGLNSPSPVPTGFNVAVKEVPSVVNVFGKRLRPGTLELVNKDYINVDSATSVLRSTVQTVVFTKRDGETSAVMGNPTDNEAVLLSARQANQSFSQANRAAFFNILQTALVSGAGEFRIATGVAPGQETIVIFNDTLTPAFQIFTYTS